MGVVATGGSLTVSLAGASPSLPSNQVVGTPTARMVDWSDGNPVFYGSSTVQTWYDRGHRGTAYGVGYLNSFGGSLDFKPSDSSASGVAYQWQQQLEATGSNHAAQAASIGSKLYLSFNIQTSGQSTSVPPFEDWFNDTTWTNVTTVVTRWAQFLQYAGMAGFTFDTELGNSVGWKATGYTGDTHTAAQNRAKARARGLQIGTAMWTAKADLEVLWYAFYPPKGWNAKVQEVVNATANAFEDLCMHDFFEGLLEGMQAAGSTTGRITLVDSSFYRLSTVLIADASASQANAYKLNSQGSRAYFSTYFDQSVWNYACDKFNIAAFTWISTDGSGFNDSTDPSTTTWSTMVADARQYSEGPTRAEFTLTTAAANSGAAASHVNAILEYADSTAISGAQAADSTTAISTVVPTITSLTASASAGTATVTCNAAHAYGVKYVKVYSGAGFNPANPAANYLGAMKMTWNQSGGAYNTNFNSAFQASTFSVAGAAGDWFVVAATSVKDDVVWASVRAV